MFLWQKDGRETEKLVEREKDSKGNEIEGNERSINSYKSYTSNPREGFRRNGNKQPLGTILLPIPSNIQDGNSVNYTDDSMNSLIGAGLGGVEGIMTVTWH